MYDVVSRKDRKVFRKGREWILSHNESLYVFSVSLCALRVKNSSSLFLAKKSQSVSQRVRMDLFQEEQLVVPCA
jgi:hypothetical protein